MSARPQEERESPSALDTEDGTRAPAIGHGHKLSFFDISNSIASNYTLPGIPLGGMNGANGHIAKEAVKLSDQNRLTDGLIAGVGVADSHQIPNISFEIYDPLQNSAAIGDASALTSPAQQSQDEEQESEGFAPLLASILQSIQACTHILLERSQQIGMVIAKDTEKIDMACHSHARWIRLVSSHLVSSNLELAVDASKQSSGSWLHQIDAHSQLKGNARSLIQSNRISKTVASLQSL